MSNRNARKSKIKFLKKISSGEIYTNNAFGKSGYRKIIFRTTGQADTIQYIDKSTGKEVSQEIYDKWVKKTKPAIKTIVFK